MAAGLGTRMKSGTPKVLHTLCGRPMLAYVLDAWDEAVSETAAAAGSGDSAGALRPVVVYSPPTAAVTEQSAERVAFAL